MHPGEPGVWVGEGDEWDQAKEKNHANVGAIPRAEQFPKP